MALHFNCLPTQLDSDQINDYLYLLRQQHDTPSQAYFKFTVYGLRFVFRMKGLKDKHIELPAIKDDKTLPVVLSKQEVRRLLIAPKLLNIACCWLCSMAAGCAALKPATSASQTWTSTAACSTSGRAKARKTATCP